LTEDIAADKPDESLHIDDQECVLEQFWRA
jgi:hypothetical protein